MKLTQATLKMVYKLSLLISTSGWEIMVCRISFMIGSRETFRVRKKALLPYGKSFICSVLKKANEYLWLTCQDQIAKR